MRCIPFAITLLFIQREIMRFRRRIMMMILFTLITQAAIKIIYFRWECCLSTYFIMTTSHFWLHSFLKNRTKYVCNTHIPNLGKVFYKISIILFDTTDEVFGLHFCGKSGSSGAIKTIHMHYETLSSRQEEYKMSLNVNFFWWKAVNRTHNIHPQSVFSAIG